MAATIMQAGKFSRTAEVMALFRALETAQPVHSRLFHDPFAAAFLPSSLAKAARWSAVPVVGPLVLRVADALWPGARTSGVARTRLIDDWVSESVAAGARQVVLLGAGFDSRAWRLPALAGLRSFEVDHPATSAEKRRCIAASGPDIPHVTFVPIDFDREAPADALARAGFDPATPSVVIWEGVTNYLTADAVARVLAWAGALAPGSRLIFTYVHQDALTDPARFDGAEKILRAVARTGEPWTLGLRPEALPGLLRGHGLTIVEDLGADDYRARYFGQKATGMRGYAFYRAVLAEVAPTRR